MKVDGVLQPAYYVHFNLAQITALCNLGAMHYDAKCKAACIDSHYGPGFVYKWKRTIEALTSQNIQELGARFCDRDQLQTVMKILEMRQYAHDLDQAMMADIEWSLRRAYTRMNNLYSHHEDIGRKE